VYLQTRRHKFVRWCRLVANAMFFAESNVMSTIRNGRRQFRLLVIRRCYASYTEPLCTQKFQVLICPVRE
jgi:hypothetical protein